MSLPGIQPGVVVSGVLLVCVRTSGSGFNTRYSKCQVDPAQWAMLRARLITEIDEGEDSLRFYRLGANWRSKVEHVGAKASYDPDGPLVL